MKLRDFLLRRQHPSNANQHQVLGTTLTTLPPEILQMITEHLPPNDTASLVLCNHALPRTLGTRHWSSLRPGQGDEKYREAFLVTLTRDLPGHFFCHCCSRLHRRDNLAPPGPLWQPTHQLVCIKNQPGHHLRRYVRAHSGISWYEFGFPHLQLAMKRHRDGPGHGISTESLLFTEVQVSDDEKEEDQVTTLLSVEARICPRPTSLCLRIQHWALVSSTKRNKILSKTEFVEVCDHLSTRSPRISGLVRSLLEFYDTEVSRQTCPELLKCHFCNTDFQVEIKDFGNEGSALVITKWLDLGAGLTPMDTRWRVHIGKDKVAEIGTPGTAGDVRLRFESEPGLSQDSLSCQNASYLVSKRFISAMDRWSYKTWILQAGKRLPFYWCSGRTFFVIYVLTQLYTVLYVWLVFFRR